MAVAVVLLAVGLSSGCGGGSSPAVIHVGAASISKSSIDHWTSAITRGALVAGVSGVPNPAQLSPRQQALSFLIGSAWLSGEAAHVGLRPSRGEIKRLVKQQQESSPNGSAGFAATLTENGQTMADAELEARARWAATAIRKRLTAQADREAKTQVTSRVVAANYRAHLAKYDLPEQRFYDLREYIRTRAQAVALSKQLDPGKRFGEHASKEKPFRPKSFEDLPDQGIAYKAVFAARKIGVILGPVPLHGEWALFVIRRIEPAGLKPLSKVGPMIEQQLLASARKAASARLLAALQRKWIAQTDCKPGYVVQKCRQFGGKRQPERAPYAAE